ncbi:GlxA family transcriptional regulator [Alphaproteobacteria bacterium LSUCC0684]
MDAKTTRIGMILVPDFNLLAATAFLDGFRAANYLSGIRLYEWTILSPSGSSIRASNGMVMAAGPLDQQNLADVFDMVVVNSSWTPEAHRSPQLFNWLRQQARAGARLGGLDTGVFLLGYAGLLGEARYVVHFEHIAALREIFPDINIDAGLFSLEASRFSAAGGVATLDLALTMIGEVHGADLAQAAQSYVFHERIRTGVERQTDFHMSGGGFVPRILAEALNIMQSHLDQPLKISEIAHKAGISQRQLDRIFVQYTGQSPVRNYLEIRLSHAHRLVTQTDLNLLEVAVASGFSSREHFSRAYKKRFGLTPSAGRLQGRTPFQFRADIPPR